jgi:hypothetical protein
MAELDLIHRRSLTWVWWLVGVLLVAGLLWAGTALISPGTAADPIAEDGDEVIITDPEKLEPY